MIICRARVYAEPEIRFDKIKASPGLAIQGSRPWKRLDLLTSVVGFKPIMSNIVSNCKVSVELIFQCQHDISFNKTWDTNGVLAWRLQAIMGNHSGKFEFNIIVHTVVEVVECSIQLNQHNRLIFENV